MQKKILNNQAFTLIEIMIATGLFVVILIISINIFLQAVANQNKSLASKNLQESLNYALTSMSNEVISARQDPTRCNGVFGVTCLDSRDYLCVVNDRKNLVFVNSLGNCVSYNLVTDANNLWRIRVSRENQEDSYLTPPDLILGSTSLQFFNRFDDHATYPLSRVNIVLQGQETDKDNKTATMLLQTTLGLYPNQ